MNVENNIMPINEELNILKYEAINIKNLIYTIRGKQVILDRDLAMRKFISMNRQVFERLINVEYKLLEHDNKLYHLREQFFICWDIFSFHYLRHYHISFITQNEIKKSILLNNVLYVRIIL